MVWRFFAFLYYCHIFFKVLSETFGSQKHTYRSNENVRNQLKFEHKKIDKNVRKLFVTLTLKGTKSNYSIFPEIRFVNDDPPYWGGLKNWEEVEG